jgi:hypothetical protein
MLSAGSTGRGQQQPPLRMRRLQLSIEAGVEPAAVADALNRALEEREAARADLDRVPTTNVLTEKKIAEIVDGLGNVAEVLNSADPSELAASFAALRLEMFSTAVANEVTRILSVDDYRVSSGSERIALSRTGVGPATT